MANLCHDGRRGLDSLNSTSFSILNDKLLALLPTRPSHPLPSGSMEIPLRTFTPNPSTTSFLHLPGEIRNQVYRLVLIHAPQSLTQATTKPHNLVPAILSTCRQIAQEATSILYTLNTFVAHPSLLTSLPHLHCPTRPLYTPGLHTRIRRWRITVRIDCDARFSEDDVTKAFSGAEELEVEAKEAMFRGAGNGVLMLFKGVRGVKRARVCGSIEREFAEWLEESMERVVGSPCVEKDVEVFVRKGGWGDGNR